MRRFHGTRKFGGYDYIDVMMMKFVLVLATAVLIQSTPGLADKTDEAIEIVSCVNAANGHAEPVFETPWEFTQAVIELPYEHELERLADGYFFVGGRKLGYHGTWFAFLDITESDWFAYEVRDQNDELWVFASSFVPPEVVSAFGDCGVKWGGFWDGEYPIVILDPPVAVPLPEEQRLPKNPLENGAELLPPIGEAD